MKLVLFSLLITASAAHAADYFFRPALAYTTDTEKQSSATTTTRMMADFAGGWMGTSGLTILGLYGMDNKSVSPGSTYNRTSYGGGLGWMTHAENGAYLDAVYFLSATYVAAGTTYTGSGYQLTFGYKFNVRSVGIGLQMAYRTFNYTKAGGNKLSPAYTKTNLDPMFALLFMF